MELITQPALESYLRHDRIARLLNEYTEGDDDKLTSQKWLRSTAPKRLIFERLYGDLLEGQAACRVLDVGGGLTSFTRRFARSYDYTLIELMAHDAGIAADRLEGEVGRNFIYRRDWIEFECHSSFDLVIANDLFPNVDQRLELFIRKFLPRSQEIRISLTYYNNPRFYVAHRVDADEILCMLAWDGEATRQVLAKFTDRMDSAKLDLLSRKDVSVFPNGRDVCIVSLRGDLAGS